MLFASEQTNYLSNIKISWYKRQKKKNRKIRLLQNNAEFCRCIYILIKKKQRNTTTKHSMSLGHQAK